MKYFLLFLIGVALVSYHGAQGKEKDDERDDVDEQDEENRRQFPVPFPQLGLNAAQVAAHAAANANGLGIYRPTPPPPRPTAQPVPTHGYCYSCVDCPDVKKVSHQSTCATYQDPRCVVYVEKYRNGKELYVRGCVSERGSCDEIKKSHGNQPNVKLLSCDECIGDQCNSNGVARSLPDLTAALFFVVLTPILTKYALS